jgi:hypothetical protein
MTSTDLIDLLDEVMTFIIMYHDEEKEPYAKDLLKQCHKALLELDTTAHESYGHGV